MRDPRSEPSPNGTPDLERLRRLAWQCRRGMLELDYLFERFLELGYGDLDAKDQAVFERLLACQDQDLQRWLVLGRPAPDPDLERLVRRLVAVASQSPQGGAS